MIIDGIYIRLIDLKYMLMKIEDNAWSYFTDVLKDMPSGVASKIPEISFSGGMPEDVKNILKEFGN